MKIIGLTRIRNEEAIIKDTLDHWAKICTGGIYVYDDVSDDKTVEICKSHPSVKKVIEGEFWDSDRERAEHENRQSVLYIAQQDANKDDWFVYFDADERIYFKDWNLMFNKDVTAIACKLYDIYITPEDVDKSYLERDWVGPEYRTIVMFFRNNDYISYDKPDQRIVNLPPDSKVYIAGFVKHFGKGISVDHWNETCLYYIKNFPKYSKKWQSRLGKAIKQDYKSDFENSLVKFSDIICGHEVGFPLESQVYGKN